MATHDDLPGRGAGDGPDAETDEALVSELRAIRPAPRPEFRRELDRRAAAGFPPRRRDHARAVAPAGDDPGAASSRRGLRKRLGLPGWLRLGPVMAGAAVACAIATAVVVSGPDPIGGGGGGAGSGDDAVYNESAAMEAGSGGGAAGNSAHSPDPADQAQSVRGDTGAATDEAPAAKANQQYAETTPGEAAADMDMAPGSGSGTALSRTSASAQKRLGGGAPIAANRNQRAVERDASITLAAEPADVPDVSAGVLRVVEEHDGIVLSSTSRGGAGLEGNEGAEFNLKIPSGNLSAALADLSELAAVSERQENTLDITAPTISMSDRLQEAQAKVRGLLKQLAEATTDSERETIEIDLAPAQRRVARLRTKLDRLQRRASFSSLYVSVVTGEAAALPGDDEWTLADAAGDALQVLTVVAGVLLVAAAILTPLALILLIGWAVRRLWVKRARESALRGSER